MRYAYSAAEKVT